MAERSVRHWRANQDPRWIAFISDRASEGLGQLEVVSFRTDIQKSSPEQETQDAARRYQLLQRELDRATEAGRLNEIGILNRSAEAAHRLLMACRAAEVEHQRVCGTLIERSQFDALVNRYLRPLKDAVASMPGELCQRVNYQDPGLAREILEDWIHERLTPRLKEAAGATSDTDQINESTQSHE